jgi:hypothetical protein
MLGMRYIAGLIIVLGLVVGAFWWLGQHQAKNPPPPPPSRPPEKAESWDKAIMSTEKAATPAPVVQRPTAPARPVVAASQRSKVEAAARQANVRIVSYNEGGGVITVKVEWTTDNAAQGGDFLDAMIRQGMRDFDDLGKGQVMRGGRRVFFGSYRLKM